VAGVVGKKKYAYDIWGDTVNVASRMESNGEPGKVNISSSTYDEIKEHYQCLHRGKISAKNIGEVDMYFVESKITKPALELVSINA
jgi:class 3 adenylate cyclase